MKINSLPVIYISFSNRKSRSYFVYEHFKKYFVGTVLDVGCFEAPLRELIGSNLYTGIDIVGSPDLFIDLEKIDLLPFQDRSFDCVLCIDVLEHLDNLHQIFDEIVRVAKNFVIVSLPNCWCNARKPIVRGKGSIGHYGLPLEKPLDRHKWFFNLEEAIYFIQAKSNQLKLKIREQFITEKPRLFLIRWIRKLIFPGDRYYNRYSAALWTVLERSLY